MILPSTTGFERQDVVTNDGITKVAVFSHAAIAPLFNSKSDYDIYSSVANALGVGTAFNQGYTDEQWLQTNYARTTIPMTYDQFKSKGFYVMQIPSNYTSQPFMLWYYNKPANQITSTATGLTTPTGKIEIFSTTLFGQYGANNPQIPPVPHYIPAWNGVTDPAKATYPLQLVTSHPKYRFHEQFGDNIWLRELYQSSTAPTAISTNQLL